ARARHGPGRGPSAAGRPPVAHLAPRAGAGGPANVRRLGGGDPRPRGAPWAFGRPRERRSLAAGPRRVVEPACLQGAQIAGDLGRLEPVVVAAVHVADRHPCELFGRDVVEAGDVHRHEGATDLLDVAVAEGTDAARLAETVMALLAAELVVAELALTGDQ